MYSLFCIFLLTFIFHLSVWKLHIQPIGFNLFFLFVSNIIMPSLECIENAYVAYLIITELHIQWVLKKFLKHFCASQFECKNFYSYYKYCNNVLEFTYQFYKITPGQMAWVIKFTQQSVNMFVQTIRVQIWPWKHCLLYSTQVYSKPPE